MDYYKILGVDKTASQEEIKKAYKKLAMQTHPDRNNGDDAKFKQINEAYDTLKDPQRKKNYDNPQQENNFYYNSGNVNDIFDTFFRQTRRQQRRNADLKINISIELEDVYTGKNVIGRYNTHSGREEIATLRLPPGIEHNSMLRVRGLGDDSIPHLPRGDLIVRINIKPHKRYIRDGIDLRTKVNVNMFDLILGTDIILEKLTGGPLHVKIPKGTNPGTVLSVNGYGLPGKNKTGNLYIEIKSITPKIKDQELIKRIQTLNDDINRST